MRGALLICKFQKDGWDQKRKIRRFAAECAAEEEPLFQMAIFRIMHVIRNIGERKSPFRPVLGLSAA